MWEGFTAWSLASLSVLIRSLPRLRILLVEVMTGLLLSRRVEVRGVGVFAFSLKLLSAWTVLDRGRRSVEAAGGGVR